VTSVVNGYYFNHKEHKGNYTKHTKFLYLSSGSSVFLLSVLCG